MKIWRSGLRFFSWDYFLFGVPFGREPSLSSGAYTQGLSGAGTRLWTVENLRFPGVVVFCYRNLGNQKIWHLKNLMAILNVSWLFPRLKLFDRQQSVFGDIWGNEKWSWIITWAELFLFALRKGFVWCVLIVWRCRLHNDNEWQALYFNGRPVCVLDRWKNLRRKQSWTQIQSVYSSLIWHGYGEQTEHNAFVSLRLQVSWTWKFIPLETLRGLRDIPCSSIFSIHIWPLQHTEDQFGRRGRQWLKMMTCCKTKGSSPQKVPPNHCKAIYTV